MVKNCKSHWCEINIIFNNISRKTKKQKHHGNMRYLQYFDHTILFSLNFGPGKENML